MLSEFLNLYKSSKFCSKRNAAPAVVSIFSSVFCSWWVFPCMTFSQAQVYSCVTDLSCWTFYYLVWCSVTVTEIPPAYQHFSSVVHWQLSYYLFPDACQSLLWAVVCQLSWGFLGLVFLLNASLFISSIFSKPSLFSLGYIVNRVLDINNH